MHIIILHAHTNNPPSLSHTFIELFSDREKLNLFLKNHPEIIQDQITGHEIDPS